MTTKKFIEELHVLEKMMDKKISTSKRGDNFLIKAHKLFQDRTINTSGLRSLEAIWGVRNTLVAQNASQNNFASADLAHLLVQVRSALK